MQITKRQNLPSRGEIGAIARNLFIASEGMKLVVCDYSNVETRIFAEYSGDETLVKAFNDDLDVHSLTASGINNVPYEEFLEKIEAGDKEAKKQRAVAKTILFGCVPLDTEILTQRGWITYDQVVPGVDKTIGYNQKTGKNEWTTITHVQKYEDAPVEEWSHNTLKFRATPNHRWLVDRRQGNQNNRRYTEPYMEEQQNLTSENRLILSQPFQNNQVSSEITPREAGIIGWLVTDGTIKRGKGEGPSQGVDRVKRGFQARIIQKNLAGKEHIEELLQYVKHSVYEYPKANGTVVYHICPQFARNLWGKADLDNKTLTEFVLGLTDEAREEWNKAVYLAEGTKSEKQVLTQNRGEVYDALVLSTYLQGYLPGVSSNGVFEGIRGTNENMKIHFTRPRRGLQTIKKKNIENQDVWCPTTELGTWTARQGDSVFLTGNSAYGMGYKKLRNTLLIQSGIELTPEEAKQQLDDFNSTYQGMTDWKKEVMAYAGKTGFVITKLGKKRRLPDVFSHDRSLKGRAQRQAVNSVIQGTAADALYLAMPIINDFCKSLGGGLISVVHDEVICEVPERYAEFAFQQIKELMVAPFNTYMTKVKLVAEGSYADKWGEAK